MRDISRLSMGAKVIALSSCRVRPAVPFSACTVRDRVSAPNSARRFVRVRASSSGSMGVSAAEMYPRRPAPWPCT